PQLGITPHPPAPSPTRGEGESYLGSRKGWGTPPNPRQGAPCTPLLGKRASKPPTGKPLHPFFGEGRLGTPPFPWQRDPCTSSFGEHTYTSCPRTELSLSASRPLTTDHSSPTPIETYLSPDLLPVLGLCRGLGCRGSL